MTVKNLTEGIEQKQATDPGKLEAEFMSPHTSLDEKGHWARREISRLKEKKEQLERRIDGLEELAEQNWYHDNDIINSLREEIDRLKELCVRMRGFFNLKNDLDPNKAVNPNYGDAILFLSKTLILKRI